MTDLADLVAHAKTLLDHATIAYAEAGGSLSDLGAAVGRTRQTAKERMSAARARIAEGRPLDLWVTAPDPADPIRGWRETDRAAAAE